MTSGEDLPGPPRGPVAGLVLAAGESRRMGSPKLLLPFGPRTLIELVVDAVRHDVDRTVVVLGAAAGQVCRALADRPVQFVTNADYRLGMTTSVQAGIRAVPEAAAYLICLGDQPGLAPGLVAALLAAWRRTGRPLVVPVSGTRRGHPVILAACLRDEVLDLGPHQGLHEVTRRHAAAAATVPVDEAAALLDVDTPEDYQALLRRAAGPDSGTGTHPRG